MVTELREGTMVTSVPSAGWFGPDEGRYYWWDGTHYTAVAEWHDGGWRYEPSTGPIPPEERERRARLDRARGRLTAWFGLVVALAAASLFPAGMALSGNASSAPECLEAEWHLDSAGGAFFAAWWLGLLAVVVYGWVLYLGRAPELRDDPKAPRKLGVGTLLGLFGPLVMLGVVTAGMAANCGM